MLYKNMRFASAAIVVILAAALFAPFCIATTCHASGGTSRIFTLDTCGKPGVDAASPAFDSAFLVEPVFDAVPHSSYSPAIRVVVSSRYILHSATPYRPPEN